MILVNEGIEKLVKELHKRKNFIFDMDGTLINIEDVNYKAFARVFGDELGQKFDNEMYQRDFSGKPSSQSLPQYIEENGLGGEYNPDDIVRKFKEFKLFEITHNAHDVVKNIPGSVMMVNFLRDRKYNLCLATSTIREFTEILLNYFEIFDEFDKILVAEDVKRGKPDPEMYMLALQRLECKASEAVVFEDSRSGIQAAKAAGILCVGVLTHGKNDDFVGNADFVIDDYRILLEKIDLWKQ